MIRLAALLAVTAFALSAGQARTQVGAAELSFTMQLRENLMKAEICAAAPGSVPRALRVTGPRPAQTGDWSPDGTMLALTVWSPGSAGIRLVKADGLPAGLATRPRRDEMDSSASWSPDGTKLAFARYTGTARSGVWVVTLATGEELQISTRYAGTLDWSPTGDLIAADTGGEFRSDIDLLRPTGGVERTIRAENSPSFTDGVSWSPDGTRLAIGGGEIVERNGNAVGRYAPSENDYVARLPAWSPDGSTIAYERGLSYSDARTNVRVLAARDLFLGSPSGTAPVRLTATSGRSEQAPAWRAASAPSAGSSQPCVIAGTARGETIRGTGRAELIDAAGGNDRVYAGGGNDFVVGGRGADLLVGGPGRDELWGEDGADRLQARDRNRDLIRGGWGRDRAWVDRRGDLALGVERIFRR